MENIDFATLFQGIGDNDGKRLVTGFCQSLSGTSRFVTYLSGLEGSARTYGYDSDGIGHGSINCGTLMMPDGTLGNLFLDPMLSDTDDLMNTMQIDFLQPVYTLTFSNGLIACFVFMGIGTLLDVGFLLQNRLRVYSLLYVPNSVRSLPCPSLPRSD